MTKIEEYIEDKIIEIEQEIINLSLDVKKHNAMLLDLTVIHKFIENIIYKL